MPDINTDHIVSHLLDEVARAPSSGVTRPGVTYPAPEITLESLRDTLHTMLLSVHGIDPKGKIIVIRLKPEVLSQVQRPDVRKHLEMVYNMMTTHGALGVIVAPEELRLEELSDEDLKRAGLTRVKAAKGTKPPPVRKDILPCEEV